MVEIDFIRACTLILITVYGQEWCKHTHTCSPVNLTMFYHVVYDITVQICTCASKCLYIQQQTLK